MENLNEVRELIDKLKSNGFEYGKPLDYFLKRNRVLEEIEFKQDILNLKNLVKIVKQSYPNEVRYVLYFVYSSKIGRVYTLTFRDRIRVITIFPLGRTTLRKYKKTRFK